MFHNGPIYTGDGSSVWDELRQRTAARLIIPLCINMGKQTNYPSTRAIAIVSLVRRPFVANSSRQMIRLLSRIYTHRDGLSDELPFFTQARPRRMICLLRVGCEMVDSQQGALHRLDLAKLSHI